MIPVAGRIMDPAGFSLKRFSVFCERKIKVKGRNAVFGLLVYVGKTNVGAGFKPAPTGTKKRKQNNSQDNCTQGIRPLLPPPGRGRVGVGVKLFPVFGKRQIKVKGPIAESENRKQKTEVKDEDMFYGVGAPGRQG
ncbi:MAG: hypothetical protein WBQ36_15665 [Desulfobaccales bacterium]